MELINVCLGEKAERIVRITGNQDKKGSRLCAITDVCSEQALHTFLERDLASTVTLNPSRRPHGNQSGCSACGVCLLLCLDFLHPNCFHMAGNVILELPLASSSLSHQGFCHLPPPSILSWGLRNSSQLGGAISAFSHTH